MFAYHSNVSADTGLSFRYTSAMRPSRTRMTRLAMSQKAEL